MPLAGGNGFRAKEGGLKASTVTLRKLLAGTALIAMATALAKPYLVSEAVDRQNIQHGETLVAENTPLSKLSDYIHYLLPTVSTEQF